MASVLAATLQLCACQAMSGLDALHVQPRAASDAGALDQTVDAGSGHADADTEHELRSLVGRSARFEVSHPGRDAEPAQAHDQPPQPDAATPEADAGSGHVEPDAAEPEPDAAEPEPDAAEHDAATPEPDASQPENAEPACALSSGAACAVAPQCGCASDENCVIELGALTCVAAGSIEENHACSESSDCRQGYQCESGACARLCDASQPECSAGAACVPMNAADGAAIAGVHICESNCNLSDPQRGDHGLNACGPELLCVAAGEGSRCTAGARARMQHGERCQDALDCAPGFGCTAAGTCAHWCSTASDCPGSFGCDTTAAVSVGGAAFGMCTPLCLGDGEETCDLHSQCGCASDRSCDAALSGERIVRQCRSVGSVPLYERCAMPSDCGRGAQCIDELCQPICAVDADCARYSRCESNHFANMPDEPAGATCHRPCDPGDPHRVHASYAACQPGTACDVAADGASYCRQAALGGVAGVSCKVNSDCGVGFTCTSAGSCVQLCRNDAECQTGRCNAFAPPQYATNIEWGFCS